MSSAYAIEVIGITKLYPGVHALDGVSLKVEAGSCHAFMGENGAGKSTLGKILAGLIQPDTGEIQLFGKSIRFRSPMEASRAGVSIVHQELIALDNLSVEENLAMESMPSVGPFVNFGEVRKQALDALQAVEAQIDPASLFGGLSTSHQQLVLIAAALAKGARVVIFDEPTSSLSSRETEILFRQIGRLKSAGVTCIYISHRMDEIVRLCDWVSVLRDGKHVATARTRDIDREQLVTWMIGRNLEFEPWTPPALGDVALEVRGLSSPGKFSDISFAVRKGEILGMAGLVGSGRSEVAEAVFGLDKRMTGEILLGTEPPLLAEERGQGERSQSQSRGTVAIRPRCPAQMLEHGVGLVPEDRKRQGLVMGFNARENITLPTLTAYASAGIINSRRERRTAEEEFARLGVRARSIESQTLGLSGGNQQKLVLAKWLAARCEVLILDEPTRGIDIGAKAEIHRLIREMAEAGKAVIVISSELPELLGLATRIIVLKEGKMQGELPREEASEQALLRLMTGTARNV